MSQQETCPLCLLLVDDRSENVTHSGLAECSRLLLLEYLELKQGFEVSIPPPKTAATHACVLCHQLLIADSSILAWHRYCDTSFVPPDIVVETFVHLQPFIQRKTLSRSELVAFASKSGYYLRPSELARLI